MNELYLANPIIIQTSKDLKFLLSKFGPYTGRYLIKYPNHWSEIIINDDISDLEAERIKTILRRATQNLQIIAKSELFWDAKLDWNNNAKKILSFSDRKIECITQNSNEFGFIDIEDFDPPPTTEERVFGLEDEYVRVSKILLLLSPEINFIDPYIDLERRNYFNVLKSMLMEASKGKCRRFIFWTRLSSISKYGLNNEVIFRLEDILQRLKNESRLPDSSKIEIYLLQDEADEKKMHARYLLSIKGGIRFDQGFQRLPKNRKVDISPIGKQLHDELLEQFNPQSISHLIEKVITTA